MGPEIIYLYWIQVLFISTHPQTHTHSTEGRYLFPSFHLKRRRKLSQFYCYRSAVPVSSNWLPPGASFHSGFETLSGFLSLILLSPTSIIPSKKKTTTKEKVVSFRLGKYRNDVTMMIFFVVFFFQSLSDVTDGVPCGRGASCLFPLVP